MSALLYHVSEGSYKLPDTLTGATIMRLITLGLIACLALTACETIKGAGRDLQNTGEALDKAV